MKLTRPFGVLAAALAIALGGCSTLSQVGSLNPFHGKEKNTVKIKGTRIPVGA